MADYLENGLRATEKSLRDVVLPALDPADPLAREQLNLAIDYLSFLRTRLDYATHQLRFELELYRDMAEQIAALADGALPTDAMVGALDASAVLRADVWASPADLRAALTQLAGAVDAVVAAAARSDDDALRGSVDRAVLDASAHWIDLDRSWYRPIAVDPDVPGIAPLSSFFPYARKGEGVPE